MKGMRVRSESSYNRMLQRSQYNNPLLAAGEDEEEEDDSTYEVSSESESCSDEFEMEQEAECELLVPIESQPVEEDGQSDYQGSDDGQGEEDLPNRSQPLQRYLHRASIISKSLNITTYWITRLSTFSPTQRRWVNKGPMILYFANEATPRLMGNYLYGTQSYCIDMQVYEHFEFMLRNQHVHSCQFSSFGYHAVRQCDTMTEKVPLQRFFPNVKEMSLPVYQCTSIVQLVPEPCHSLFTVRFLNHQGILFLTRTCTVSQGSGTGNDDSSS
jgi:hypothetical protein